MKTPDETKKGLECCYTPVEPAFRCEECPYHGSIVCKMRLHTDASAYIKQLEEQKQRMEREWVAAVEDLKMLAKCPTCAHYETPCGTEPCMSCHPIERQGYVWRGVKEGET